MPKAFPATLLDFQRMFPDEEACLQYLYELRWPGGFVCPSCGTAGDPEKMMRKRQRQKQDNGRPVRGEIYAGRLRVRHVTDRSSITLTGFVADNVATGTTIATDGWQGYNGLKNLGYGHEAVVLGGDPALAQAALPMIHLVFSNLKAWILGTHHGVSDQHLQAYLNEYVFRFNRRFYPMGMFNSVLGIAAAVKGPTYVQLYRGKWTHPNG